MDRVPSAFRIFALSLSSMYTFAIETSCCTP
jgi:hypothetical protein